MARKKTDRSEEHTSELQSPDNISYAVFRDSSMADDSTATNFDQIFETYSKNTVRKVL